jgi:hypothetical protein
MAATNKAGTTGQAAALPCAVVIPLPGAAELPVQQVRRRGRYPKGVTPLWRARLDRAPMAQAQRLMAQLEFIRNARADTWSEWVRNQEALAEISARLSRGSAVMFDLERRDQGLVSELRRLGVTAMPYPDWKAANKKEGGT